MVDLCGGVPPGSYRYGVADMPPEIQRWEAVLRDDERSWSRSAVAPKLHYHRSGYLSLNATEQLDRQGIQAPSPFEFAERHRHLFTFTARHPYRWAKLDPRANDLRLRVNGRLETFTLAGHIGPTTNLISRLPGNPFAGLVEDEDGVIAPTVVAYFDDEDGSGWYLWMVAHANWEFGAGDEPMFVLHAHDPISAADPTTSTEMLAVWSVQDEAADQERDHRRDGLAGRRLTDSSD